MHSPDLVVIRYLLTYSIRDGACDLVYCEPWTVRVPPRSTYFNLTKKATAFAAAKRHAIPDDVAILGMKEM